MRPSRQSVHQHDDCFAAHLILWRLQKALPPLPCHVKSKIHDSGQSAKTRVCICQTWKPAIASTHANQSSALTGDLEAVREPHGALPAACPQRVDGGFCPICSIDRSWCVARREGRFGRQGREGEAQRRLTSPLNTPTTAHTYTTAHQSRTVSSLMGPPTTVVQGSLIRHRPSMVPACMEKKRELSNACAYTRTRIGVLDF